MQRRMLHSLGYAPARCDAVGLVLELGLAVVLGKVLEQLPAPTSERSLQPLAVRTGNAGCGRQVERAYNALDDVRVDLGDAVHGVRADDGEVRHADLQRHQPCAKSSRAGWSLTRNDAMAALSTERAHLLDRALLDDGHAPQAVAVARPAPLDVLQEEQIDVKDDLHVADGTHAHHTSGVRNPQRPSQRCSAASAGPVPRQQAAHQVDRPHLERLRQDGVVGVRVGARDNVPALVPLEALAVPSARDGHHKLAA